MKINFFPASILTSLLLSTALILPSFSTPTYLMIEEEASPDQCDFNIKNLRFKGYQVPCDKFSVVDNPQDNTITFRFLGEHIDVVAVLDSSSASLYQVEGSSLLAYSDYLSISFDGSPSEMPFTCLLSVDSTFAYCSGQDFFMNLKQ